MMQGSATRLNWRHDGNLGSAQFCREAVFFQNRRVRPSIRSVELRDDGIGIFQADLIDPVFVAIQRHQSPIWLETQTLNTSEYLFGLQLLVSEIAGSGHGCLLGRGRLRKANKSQFDN